MDFVNQDRMRRAKSMHNRGQDTATKPPKVPVRPLASPQVNGTKFFSRSSEMIQKSKEKKFDKIIIRNRWKIYKLLGVGGFGQVYSVEDIQVKSTSIRDRMQAAKMEENIAGKASLLTVEASVLKQAMKANCTRLPKFIAVGKNGLMTYLIMEFLGPSLTNLMKRYTSLSTNVISVLNIFRQCCLCLKEMHDMGIVHRDIKPSNFCIGYKNPDHIYIIDFGLARQFKHEGKIRPVKPRDGFKGTNRYVSMAIHNSKVAGPSDDLKSLIYILLELLGVRLPWSGVKTKEIVKTMKVKYTVKNLLAKAARLSKNHKQVVPFLKHIHKYTEELKNDEEIDFGVVLNQLDQAHASISKDDNRLEWIDEIEERRKSNTVYEIDEKDLRSHDSDDFLVDDERWKSQKVKKKSSFYKKK